MNTEKMVAYHVDKASDIALEIIERKARAILRQHSNLDEFVMAMGLASFTSKGEYDDWRHILAGNGCPKYMQGLEDFIMQWDEYLRLTGEPMRFTANGEKRADWGVTKQEVGL